MGEQELKAVEERARTVLNSVREIRKLRKQIKQLEKCDDVCFYTSDNHGWVVSTEGSNFHEPLVKAYIFMVEQEIKRLEVLIASK